MSNTYNGRWIRSLGVAAVALGVSLLLGFLFPGPSSVEQLPSKTQTTSWRSESALRQSPSADACPARESAVDPSEAQVVKDRWVQPAVAYTADDRASLGFPSPSPAQPQTSLEPASSQRFATQFTSPSARPLPPTPNQAVPGNLASSYASERNAAVSIQGSPAEFNSGRGPAASLGIPSSTNQPPPNSPQPPHGHGSGVSAASPEQQAQAAIALGLHAWPQELAAIPSTCLTDLPGLEHANPPYGVAGQLPQEAAISASHAGYGSHGAYGQPSQGDWPQSAAGSLPAWDSPSPAPRVAWGEGTDPTAHAEHAPYYRPRSDLASVDAFFNPHRNATEAGRVLEPQDPCDCDPHEKVFSETLFPSAVECAKCHRQIYEEWAVSNHAYAALSPMFHRFEDTLNRLAGGTVGYFCLRCHAPVATSMGLRRDQPIWNGPRVFREGVTCVACHRVTEQYGKTNGERRMEPGDLLQPVVGAGDGLGVERVLRDADHFKVRDVPQGLGQGIHRRAIKFEQLSRSEFCISCHQVAVYPQIKLEVVWDQYVASPAYREGITCQDCHMGKVPGLAEGYSIGPAAIIEGKPVLPERKHSNHGFFGPGYSIAHPGIFPHNEKADRWSVPDWLLFDWRAGWGTDAFEEALERGEFACDFPEPWGNVDDRYDAREVLEENFRLLAYKRELRKQVMENGSRIDGPYFKTGNRIDGQLVVPACEDLKLHYVVTNLNSGHNLPTASLGAQPQLWLNVVLVNPMGERVWESGYLDRNGDLADLQSEEVLAGRLQHDDQLFNLQTKFLITNVKGTDREVYLPVNTDIDQLPFIRPPGLPVSVLNHPPLIRMEAHSIAPLGSRNAHYKIPGELLSVPGWYRLSVRMRSRAEPMYFMRFVGSTDEMIRRMLEETADCHPSTVVFQVE